MIDGLRKAAQMVLSHEYSWGSPSNCNCGMLAKALGVEPQSQYAWSFMGAIFGKASDWMQVIYPHFSRECEKEADRVCTNTGLTFRQINAALSEAGIEPDDYEYIEFAGVASLEAYVKSISGRTDCDQRFNKGSFVSQFFNDLADKLELELAQQKVAEVIDEVIEEEAVVQQVQVTRQ